MEEIFSVGFVVRMTLALILSMVLVLVSGRRVIEALRKLKFGQTIYDLGPEAHKAKQGTPTMGGVLFVTSALIVSLVCHTGNWFGGWDVMLGALMVSILTMAVGMVDDYIKVAKKRSLGLTPMQKIIGQTVVALGFSMWCYFNPEVGSKIIIPFCGAEWDLGIFYIPLMTLTVIFMTNSANLQDGEDGLLSSVTAASTPVWGAVAVLMALANGVLSGAQAENLVIFAMAVTGGVVGFLWFNFNPAKVFMGDMGSMFIGGATVALAMLTRQPFLLLLISFTMVASSASVMIQVTYFKLTHGKRIFKMSPIHHHFELSGMKEPQICAMYTAVTLILSLIALAGVLALI